MSSCSLDFCTNAGKLVCSACKTVRYCCREHQRDHWAMHKAVCKAAQAAATTGGGGAAAGLDVSADNVSQCTDPRALLRTIAAANASANLKALCCRRLTELGKAAPEHAEALIRLGAFKALIDACQSRPTPPPDADGGLSEAALAAAWTICGDGDDGAAATRKQAAAAAGTLEAAAAALGAPDAREGAQLWACRLLTRVCDSDDADADARCERAFGAGALEAVVGALSASPSPGAALTEHGCTALCAMLYGATSAADARCERAAGAGAIEAVVAAMAALGRGSAAGQGCAALANLCAGPMRGDALADARRQRAVAAGAIEAVAGAGDAQGMGPAAIRAICGEHASLRERALSAGVRADVFDEE